MSQGVISSELMLFEPKAVNEGVEYLQYIECRSTNQITEDGSVDIHIKASGSLSGLKGIKPLLVDPAQVESKKSSQIQWPVPSINAELVDAFLGE